VKELGRQKKGDKENRKKILTLTPKGIPHVHIKKETKKKKTENIKKRK
jgi:hypothetical protein